MYQTVLEVLFQLRFTRGVDYYYSHFTDKEIEAERVQSLVQATRLLSWGRNPERVALEIRFFNCYMFLLLANLAMSEEEKQSASGVRTGMEPAYGMCSINASYYWPF